MQLIDKALDDFECVFGEKPVAWGCAPGRVEVLGNHTDYNEGFILSAAIDRRIVVCGRPIEGDHIKVYSRNFGSGETFGVNELSMTTSNFWVNYMEGVIDQLQKQGVAIGAFEALVLGDIPLGAGLSSSAAIEVATALFLKELYPYEMEPVDIALMCQRAENHFVGVNCGILDQFSSVMGKENHLIFLDCRDLTKVDHLPLGDEVELVLANTLATHELADGTYNRLRENCFEASKYFDSKMGSVTHLRDVTLADFEKHSGDMDDEMRRRARHVVTENERVITGVDALKSGDLARMGECMFGSHLSSRDDFGNSCDELDSMVELARDLPGCCGSRLSGGGFGGCTVNLVKSSEAEAFSKELSERYHARTKIKPEMHICRAVDGARGGVL